MSLLSSEGIQDALAEVAGSLGPESSCPHSWIINLWCQPDRVATLFWLLSESLARVAGIRQHQGKTKAWNKFGVVPEDGPKLRF